jgi:hypothetical protein
VHDALNYIIKEAILFEVPSLLWNINKPKTQEIWKI